MKTQTENAKKKKKGKKKNYTKKSTYIYFWTTKIVKYVLLTLKKVEKSKRGQKYRFLSHKIVRGQKYRFLSLIKL